MLDRLAGSGGRADRLRHGDHADEGGRGEDDDVGLAHAGARRIGRKPVLCIREPSLGPVFGIKGGAAGGGYAQVVPMEDLNLHFTGDIHAIGAANNLLAAALEAHILHGNKLGIDPLTIEWRRCLDVNDRALRQIVVGLGGRANGYPRETGFDITAASEVMAICAVANDLARSPPAARRDHCRLHIRGRAGDRRPSSKVAGAMTVLFKEVLKPNLIQTLEGQACFMHCGPFGEHRARKLVRSSPTRSAVKLGDIVITEGGFASDLGMEKFLHIVCRLGNLRPARSSSSTTVRALKHHGEDPDGGLDAVERGAANLERHIGIVQRVRPRAHRRREPSPRGHGRGVRFRPASSRSTRSTRAPS